MPIYEYRCAACEDEFERLQSINEPRLKRCSGCGGRLELMPSGPSMNFKKHSSPSAERHSKLTVNQQARQERDRLIEHSKTTGVPLKELFEDHDHH